MAADVVRFDGGLLRPWRTPDATQLVAAWNDPDIARWNQVPSDPSTGMAERWIAGWQTRYDRGVAVDMVVVADAHSPVLGEVGLSNFAAIPGGGRGALIGYWLLPAARGEGLAAAAVGACLTWARAELGIVVIAARCHQDNRASQVVAARAGFRHERDDASGNQLWFSRPREE